MCLLVFCLRIPINGGRKCTQMYITSHVYSNKLLENDSVAEVSTSTKA